LTGMINNGDMMQQGRGGNISTRGGSSIGRAVVAG